MKALRAPVKYTSFRDVGLGARNLTALWVIPFAARRHRAGDPLVMGTVTAGKLAYAGIVSCFFTVLPRSDEPPQPASIPSRIAVMAPAMRHRRRSRPRSAMQLVCVTIS